jgi:hypothetical protein
MRTRIIRLVMVASLTLPLACRNRFTPPPEQSGRGGSGPAGAPTMSPMSGYDIYLNAFHLTKDQPSHAMEAHHYCKPVNDEFAQCVLFDGNTAEAHMVGIEYIISERLFETLPAQERASWHPHNYEILSGQLILPYASPADEKKALAGKMNSYGKTWHLWMTGLFGQPGDELPLGPATLEWSYNADGEAPRGLIEQRDRRFGISTDQKRMDRTDIAGLAHPQEGVDALAPAFPYRQSIPGVVDKYQPRVQERQPNWR